LPAWAELDIEITGAGEHQTPISVVRFANDRGRTSPAWWPMT
jgi:hypothetical protein